MKQTDTEEFKKVITEAENEWITNEDESSARTLNGFVLHRLREYHIKALQQQEERVREEVVVKMVEWGYGPTDFKSRQEVVDFLLNQFKLLTNKG